jgi:murein DD-endopeptidase MepM/ murein hydrolase activator NlpD
MRTPEEWNRSYDEIAESEFIMVPAYDIRSLTDETMDELLQHRDDPQTIKTLTEKLTWSTRFFGAYDLDASEFTAIHPGIDMKLAEGTPIGSIAGGRVNAVYNKSTGLGLHVIIEHRLPDGSQYFSIYGHLGEVSVSVGDAVKPGEIVGKVGMTGKTTAPHLHLQVDKGFGEESHVANTPDHLPSLSEARQFWVHPIEFIKTYAN